MLTVAIAHRHCPSLLPVAVECCCDFEFFTCEDGSMWTGAWEWEHRDVSMEHGDGTVEMGQRGNFFLVVFCQKYFFKFFLMEMGQ